MIQYYIQTSIGQEGPYTFEELRHKSLDPQTPVWYDGISDWTVAGEIEILRPLLDGQSNPPAFLSPEPLTSGPLRPAAISRKKSDYSMFVWLGLAVLLIAALFYFLKQQDAKPREARQPSLADTTENTKPAEDPAELRRRQAAAKLAAMNKNFRNNWDTYIKVRPGKYEKGLFGGISNLKALLSNQTNYPLDVMIISVDYIKENGEKYKTEILTVYDIPAGGELSVGAPDSDRGTSVKFEIIQISSRRMNFLYSSDIDPEGKPDPYYFNR